MPENVFTTTTNAQFIPTNIANKCLQRLSSYFSVAKNVSKDSDWTTASSGLTLSIPKTGAVVANDKTQGSNFTKQNPTATATSVTLDKHKEVTFTIDDITKVAENQNTQDRYAEDGAIAIAEALETSILGLQASINNTITWNRTSAATIDSSLLLIRKFFTDQKVPVLEPKFFTCDPSIYNDLLGQQKYTDASWRGQNNSVDEGRMLKVYGFQISESQLIQRNGSPGTLSNVAFTRNGLILASRPLPRPEGFGGSYSIVNDPDIGVSVRTLFWYNGDLGAHQLTIEILYGVAVHDQRRVLEVEST